MGVEYTVTVECSAEEEPSFSVSSVADTLAALKPKAVLVDAAGIGRVVLASLQSKGLPAKALEKRPRPTLPEIHHAEERSRAADALQHKLDLQTQELQHLREYKRDIQRLLSRLD